MYQSEHMQKSMERLRKDDPTGLYAKVPRIVEAAVSEVHSNLDAFFVKSDNPEERLRCREKLHHEEGIRQVTEKIVRRFGEIYKPIILQEARAHVQEDMGYIPQESDYKDPNFWPKWKAVNETILNE